MVDFAKLLGKKKLEKLIDPIEIFNYLDKISGKEKLRDSQRNVLKEWYANRHDDRDIIVKIHTGQGKTLIGLLILQSLLNEGKGPVLYICPHDFLVAQTVEDARSFGIETVQFSDTRPPKEFLNSEKILVTNCNKLFNGKSVFGVVGSGKEPISLGGIVIDDAHTCLEIIREAFSIIVDKGQAIYKELWGLFKDSLEKQAAGTCSDISQGDSNCFMAVPFWTWQDSQREVLSILQKYKGEQELRFVWDLIKDRLAYCMSLFSGSRLEITPLTLPLDLIPSFKNAKKRIFLSATLTEDAFLVRDFGLDKKSVELPLSQGDVSYSGERLIIIPTLIDPDLGRKRMIGIVSWLAKVNGNFGVFALVPSNYHANDWENGIKTDVSNLQDEIRELKSKIDNGKAKEVIILVNKYDGIDLPDNLCRILCIDSLPSYNSLLNKYIQDVRPNSQVTVSQIAQRIEQGMGRGIRGINDWCIAFIIGDYLTEFFSSDIKRRYFSEETQMQIKIGEELAHEMKEEEKITQIKTKNKLQTIIDLVYQCLRRNQGWKEFYKQKMAEIKPSKFNERFLENAIKEREVASLIQQRRYNEAMDILQNLINDPDSVNKSWYLQLAGIYEYPFDSSKAIEKQLKAFSINDRLFRPDVGITYRKLSSSRKTRTITIVEWIKQFDNKNALILKVNNILGQLTFESDSNLFEENLMELGSVLGFLTQRPEKATGIGPDNLWQIRGDYFWVIECKNKVSLDRAGISKSEIGQLSNSIGWFKDKYGDTNFKPIIIHPAIKLMRDAFISDPIWGVNVEKLESLKEKVKRFYQSLADFIPDKITEALINQKLGEFQLDEQGLEREFLQRINEQIALK